MGAPGVPGGDHEGARAELDRVVGRVTVHGFRHCDPVGSRLQHQAAHQGAGDQLDASVGQQTVEGEIGCVLGTRWADRAGVAPLADVPPPVGLGVARPGLRPERDSGAVGPLAHARQVVRKRQRRHGVGLRARIAVGRTLLARCADALLGLLVVGVEVVERDRPVEADAVHRPESEVFRGVPRNRPAPVHPGTAHNHLTVHLARARLIGDVVVRVGVLAVGQHACPGPGSLLEGRGPPAGLDHRDGRGGVFGEPFRHHRRTDPGPDDADVAFDDAAHGATPDASIAGSAPAPTSPLHCCLLIPRR